LNVHIKQEIDVTQGVRLTERSQAIVNSSILMKIDI